MKDLTAFDRTWLERAHALGWTVKEMFGCWPNPLASRLDGEGLVHILDGKKIESIEADYAVIVADTRLGHRTRYFRNFERARAIPMWDAYFSLPPILVAEPEE